MIFQWPSLDWLSQAGQRKFHPILSLSDIFLAIISDFVAVCLSILFSISKRLHLAMFQHKIFSCTSTSSYQDRGYASILLPTELPTYEPHEPSKHPSHDAGITYSSRFIPAKDTTLLAKELLNCVPQFICPSFADLSQEAHPRHSLVLMTRLSTAI